MALDNLNGRGRGVRVPTWLALVILSSLFTGVGWWILKPSEPTCEVSQVICAIEANHEVQTEFESWLTDIGRDELKEWID